MVGTWVHILEPWEARGRWTYTRGLRPTKLQLQLPPGLPYTTRLRAIFQSLYSLRATTHFPHQTSARSLGHWKIDPVWHDRVFLDIHSMAAPPPPPKGGGLSLYANLLNPKADAQATVSGAPVVYDNGKKEDPAVKKEVNQGTQRLHTRFHIRQEAPSRIAILSAL